MGMMGTRRQAKNVTGAGNPACFQAPEVSPCLLSSVPFRTEKGQTCLKQDMHRLRKQHPCQLCLLKNEEVTVTSSSSACKGPDQTEANAKGQRGPSKSGPAGLAARPVSQMPSGTSRAGKCVKPAGGRPGGKLPVPKWRS